MDPCPFLLLAYLLAPFVFASSATPHPDGDSLLSAMVAWKVNFSSWVGSDPCQQWQGVGCNDQGRVTYLNLSNQGLIGPIPMEIGNLEYLTVLDLSNPRRPPNTSLNQITGNLTALETLINLENLNLSFNPIELDTFPSVVFKLTNLVALKIDNTRIKGQLPLELTQLTKLEYMYLANNSLSGPLHPEFSNLTHLRELSLWNNNLDSEIPPEYGTLLNLTYLNLHECNLYGGLPPELGQLVLMKNISLYGNRLTGSIPDTWNTMTQLYNLWLHRNSLTKYLPQWLTQLPGLYNVSLDYNLFYGTIPDFTNSNVKYVSFICNYLSGEEPIPPPNIIFNTSGNCFDPINNNNKIRCGQEYYDCAQFFSDVPNGSCPACSNGVPDEATCVCSIQIGADRSGVKKWTVIGSVIGVAIFILILAFMWWVLSSTCNLSKGHQYYGKHYDSQGPISDVWEGPENIVRFKIEDIVKATNDFSSDYEIGMGGFGKVFHGILDGREVAIKRAHLSSIQSSSGFRNEVLLLSRLHHKNLVRLLGFCEDKGIQILVYEYMPNGNLNTMLFKSDIFLDWLIRLDIAIGIAQGLEYLHSFADPPVIHRDIKPSNILLDSNMVAKLSDFGISKVAPEADEHLATRPAGTVGYIDPQYVLREELTTASDVYSFGVVLLELISGQRSVDSKRVDNRNLVEWATLKMKTVGLEHIVDKRLGDNYPKRIYEDMVKLGIDCASFNSEDRPSMKAVLTILDACRWSVTPHVIEVSSDGKELLEEQMSAAEDIAIACRKIYERGDSKGMGATSTEANTLLTGR